MKQIKYLLIVMALGIGTFFLFHACSKDEVKSNVKTPQIIKYVTGPYTTDLTIRREYEWKITNRPPSQSGCLTGTGLCISGDELPDPNNPFEYGGTLSSHPSDNNKLIFIFPDDYINDEDELIDNGFFNISDDVYVDADCASLVGKGQAFTILHGDYEIDNDNSGYQAVTVNISF